MRPGLIAALAAAVVGPPLFAADELPAFQPGLWSFTLTVHAPGAVRPVVQGIRRCANPSDDIRRKWRALADQTCKFTPVKRDGNHYAYSSQCQKESVRLSMKALIVVTSDQEYRVETESQTNNQVRKESLVAKREGDCAKSGGHLPVPQPRKDPGT